MDHRHCGAGNSRFGHAIFDQGVEAAQGSLHLSGCDRRVTALSRRRWLGGTRQRDRRRGD
jgi:hypothetical protein